MQRRSGELPPTKFAAKGHRSTVAGLRRFLSGKKKSRIADVLHEDAKAIMGRLRSGSGHPEERG